LTSLPSLRALDRIRQTIQTLKLGPNQNSPVVTEGWTYNVRRMQPVSITAATAISGTLTIANAYCASPDGNGDCAGNNNGNLWRESITPPGASTAFVQNFTYL